MNQKCDPYALFAYGDGRWNSFVVCGCVNLWPKKMLICQFFGKWKWASNPVGVWLNNNNNMMPIAYS